MTFFSSISSTLTSSLLAVSASACSVTEIGGHEFVELPGGPVVMGSPEFEDAPPHWVELPPFAIGQTAVSAEQYRSRIRSNDGRINRLQTDHPVTHVDWYDAHRYLAQLSRETERPTGLPTEAQWEFAARGPAVELRQVMEAELGAFRPDELREFVEGRFENFYTEIGGRIYTDPTNEAFQRLLRQAASLYSYRVYGTPSGRLMPEEAYYDRQGPGPVDWGPENGYGVKGMTGGVWEWVADWYSDDAYPVHNGSSGAGSYRSSGQNGNRFRANPRGPQAGAYKGLRGGSWYGYDPVGLRAAYRVVDLPDYRGYDFGFRGVVAPQDSRG